MENPYVHILFETTCEVNNVVIFRWNDFMLKKIQNNGEIIYFSRLETINI